MSEMAPEPDPITKVAKDLTAILSLYGQLPDQAEADSNAALMPGGRAMVALGPVANLERWGHLTDTGERLGRTFTFADLEDDDDHAPATQLITYWAEQWRRIHGAEYGQRGTLASEANFIRYQLPWAWDNLEPAVWVAFAADIRQARFSLESVLYAGERAERGVPCMYEECGGKLLRRKLMPSRDEDGNKVWVYSKWHCPSCHLEFDDAAYRLNIRAAAEDAKTEFIDGELWCSVDWAAQTVDRKDSTIRVWVHRGEVATASVLAGNRTGFVRLADVIECDAKAARRKRGRRVA